MSGAPEKRCRKGHQRRRNYRGDRVWLRATSRSGRLMASVRCQNRQVHDSVWRANRVNAIDMSVRRGEIYGPWTNGAADNSFKPAYRSLLNQLPGRSL